MLPKETERIARQAEGYMGTVPYLIAGWLYVCLLRPYTLATH